MLRFPDVPGLRPTPDRVRQTVFNWLGQELHGRRCLDLFAGSGALGLEALSRHAAEVVLVEADPVIYRALLENAAALKAEHARIVRADALQFLAESRPQFDVVFLDPPFGQGWLEKLIPLLPRHLAEDGLVYAESGQPLENRDGWEVLKRGKAGSVFYHLLKCRHGSDEP